MKNPTVILADDATCVRQTTASFLRTERHDVIAEVADGTEALRLCRKMKPDFLIADLRLPGLDGVSVLLRLRDKGPQIPVMIYTGCEDDRMLAAALDERPAALVHKTDSIEHFRAGLRCAPQGGTFYSPRASRLHGRHAAPAGLPALTGKQKELLRLLASSKSNKIAAEILGLSEKTVGHRREEIMRKLGAHDLAALTLAAVRLGLVEP